jgi:hypothetical protein
MLRCEDLIQSGTKVTFLSVFTTLFVVSSDIRAILCLTVLAVDGPRFIERIGLRNLASSNLSRLCSPSVVFVSQSSDILLVGGKIFIFGTD